MPKDANGRICYVEIPATDVDRSAGFYAKVFGWHTRKRGDGSLAFDDGAGAVSGTWVTGRPASSADPGLLIYIMVDDCAAMRQVNVSLAKVGSTAVAAATCSRQRHDGI